MKTLYERLNKKYDQPILKRKEEKKIWKRLCEHMEIYGIEIKGKNDAWYFQYEIIENSLLVKKQFEDVFFDTYVSMHDYWYDLTYQERKKQMNIEIAKLKDTLASFQEDGQDIFMPCFDAKFNHLYTDEIVLLDLKQYHIFIRTFAKQIQFDGYGVYPFLNGFSSAHVMANDGDSFVLYHEACNRLYLYKKKCYVSSLSFHPKHVPQEKEILFTLAQELLLEDENALIDTVLDSDLIGKRMKKNITKYKQKKMKVEAKKRKQKQE